jgi:Domain of unknown function (DUF222)
MTFTGTVDPETGELFEAMLHALGKPQPVAPGVPDLRTQAERYGDATADILHLAARTDDLPEHGGQKPRVHVYLDYQGLLRDTDTAVLESGVWLHPPAASLATPAFCRS